MPRDVPAPTSLVEEAIDAIPEASKKRKRSEGGTAVKDEDGVQFLTNEEADLYRQLQVGISRFKRAIAFLTGADS